MAKKKYDLAVKTGEYTDSSGKKKGRYLNIGSVMANDDGGEFILINRTFNPAGVPNPDNKDSVLVSKFESDKKGNGKAQAEHQEPAPVTGGGGATSAMPDDEIPFISAHGMF
jgi:hypothetical protein